MVVVAALRRLIAAWVALQCAAGLAAPLPPPERIDGVVTRVSDGDTLWLRPDPTPQRARPKPLKLRLVGLDAPELCQAHGREAGAALSALVLGQRVTVKRRASDQHGRALGTLWRGEQDVGAQLVHEGHAWSSRYRGDPGPYATEEAAARAARRGLFAAARPVEPWRFRREHGPCDAGAGAPRPP